MFDVVAVVDWSARARPATGADSIWIATVEGGECRVENVSTRTAAVESLASLARPGRRTLVGVDFSLGFPRGTAAAIGVSGTPWTAMWRLLAGEIADGVRNENNRFEVAASLNRRFGAGPGPFWGCPAAQAGRWDALTPTRPPRRAAWPPQWRHVEARLHARGHRPFDAWQLLGAGSVGSQSLLGIAALQRLRDRLGARLCVWPFDTGLVAPFDPPAAGSVDAPAGRNVEMVVAEVWPSLWPVDVPPGAVKDAAQVEATTRRLTALDRAGTLHGTFTPACDEATRADVVAEEGWVLGVD